jgi:TRAP-type C4-dicarboxylate transport system permease small subunit
VRHWLQRAADLVGGAIFAGLFLVFLIQITARFIFDRPLPWTDEGAVILYIWAILWACAFMVRSREHVVFDLVYQAVGPTAQRLMRIAGSLLLAVLAAIAIPGSWDYVSFMKREGTPVLGIPFMWVFLPFVLLLVSMVLRFGWIAWQAIRGRDGEL